MPNRRSKNPQGHRKPKTPKPDAGSSAGADVIQLPGTEATTTPKPPKGLLVVTRQIWSAFWESEVCQLVGPADGYALDRWIKSVDQRERLAEIVAKNPTVEGSQEQPVLNPLAKRLDALDADIRKAEQQFGMTPRARADLGLATGGAAMTAQRLNEMAMGGNPDGAGRQNEDKGGVIDGESEEIEGYESV